MIYDYSTNPPNLVNDVQANVDFPGFYFAEEYDYFIYPQQGDRIIYNFSLGLFFKFIRDGEYNEIAIRPLISLDQMGDLIGYTQADPNQLPTLYFQHGRLTLQHSHCRNIGWHPRKTKYKYVYGNILNPNHPKKLFSNGTVFNEGAFEAAVAEAKGSDPPDVRLIELYYNNDNIIKSRHVSRSRLIPGPHPNFVLNALNQFLAANEIAPPPF